ncbi:hypothetical protein IWW54_004818, partial [Coemansia sp. RSA 2705]
NGSQISCSSMGQLILSLDDHDDPDLILDEVFVTPDAAANLISIYQLAKRGLKVVFEADHCDIFDQA